MAMTTAKRPLAPRTNRTQKNDVDELTSKLSSGLQISEPKPRKGTVSKARNAPKPTESVEERRSTAMRNVNTVLQSLSSVAQTNGKASSSRKGSTNTATSIATQASAASASLRLLRKLSPGVLDVERASLSLVGKLLSLEMNESALELLSDIQISLPSYYQPSGTKAQLTIFHLPLPAAPSLLDPSLQASISTFFSHAIKAAAGAVASNPSSLDAFLVALDESGCIISWIPHLAALAGKPIDSLLKRSYVVLTSTFTLPASPPSQFLRIRFFALRLLLLASEVDVNPFWEQSLKFAATYAKTVDSPETGDEKTRVLLSCFSDIVKAAEERPDHGSVLAGKGWIMFCEYWASLSKRAEDLPLLNRVVEYIRNAPSTSNLTPKSVEKSQGGIDKTHRSSDELSLFFTQACAMFGQATATLDQAETSGGTNNDQSPSCLEASITYLQELRKLCSDSTLIIAFDDKLRRAVEKLRRSCLKRLNTLTSGSNQWNIVRTLTENIVDFLDSALERDLSQRPENEDFTVSALDALFNLATSILNPHRPDTSDCAFDYLTHGVRITDVYAKRMATGPDDAGSSSRNLANYLRCLSGAFFNAAGTLYKADKHGLAIRFLREACPMAIKAIGLYEDCLRLGCKKAEGKSPDGDIERDREVWKSHKLQLYRRWELMGVCYTKTGDRKLAHEAFVSGITCYPFEQFSNEVPADISGDVLASDAHKQVASMIDKLTYIAAAELFLRKGTSLLRSLREAQVPELVIGTVLMRQIRSLNESRWKPDIREVIGSLLDDLLSVYGSEYPLQRSRVLILQLEHLYFGDSNADQTRVVEISNEIQNLLLDEKTKTGGESRALRRQLYIAMAQLWIVLYTHRSGKPVEEILQYTNKVLVVLEVVASSPSPFETIAMDLPTDSRVGKSGGSKETAVRGRTRGLPPAPRKAAPLRNSRKPPVTPKLREGPGPGQISSVVMASAERSQLPLTSEFSELIGLLLTVSELLGLLGLYLARMQLLTTVRRLSEKTENMLSEAYIQATSNLASELLKVGKINQAITILAPLATSVKDSRTTNLAAVALFLRYAEALALSGEESKSVTPYEEAVRISELLPPEDKGLSTSARIRNRVASLEQSAIATSVFAVIQDAKSNAVASLKAHMQSLRLLNRATETLSRLAVSKRNDNSANDSDPFAMADLAEALPIASGTPQGSKKIEGRSAQQRFSLDGLEWRVASALLTTMFALSQAYVCRGSAREAEYFVQQAEELSRVVQSPLMICRSLLRKSEIHILLGQSQLSQESLAEAKIVASDVQGLDGADMERLKGDLSQKLLQNTDARTAYVAATRMLTESQQQFDALDNALLMSKSPSSIPQITNTFVPGLLALILKQHVWLLRDDLGDEYESSLEQLLALPQLPDIDAQVNSLLGKLALHDIHERFRTDMSLSSLAESTIALPMGMTCEKSVLQTPPQDILEALEQADDLFCSGLRKFAERGSVVHVRAAAVSSALITAYQASLGNASMFGPALAARLLDMASSVTLRRELIEAIPFKFPDSNCHDDLQWPSLTPIPKPSHSTTHNRQKDQGLFASSSDDEGECSPEDDFARKYWEHILHKHQSQAFVPPAEMPSEIDSLPENWVVISISLTEDRSTLLVSRQRPHREPLIFCVPLRGRRYNDDDEHFTFDDALSELRDIIHSSDEGTRQASRIDSNDKEGKAAWWSERKRLDQRMKELVENIEFCWLGAFKTILSQPMRMPPDIAPSLRSRFEKVFKGILGSQEKKSQKAKLKLDTSLLELFSTLSSTCRDEELEDLIYFVLDLYHFHGLPIALAEVDVDVVSVDLRSALEEHHARTRGRIAPEPDAHTFLVLDKNMQAIPWESIPILRGRSVSRIPSIAFLTDRLALARCQQGVPLDTEEEKKEEGEKKIDRAPVDPSKAYFVLNPGGDLLGTEDRFKGWVNDMGRVGWEGIIGQPPSEQQLLNALSRKDLVVYFGHGGAEQFVRSHKIRHLQRCAATMLWGCSSGALRDMGDFDRIGTPNNYMLAGCPTLVANLWDVTDRDIDKFALAVFGKMSLDPTEVGKWAKGKRKPGEGKVSVVAAVAQSRDACKLKYLTGAAVVVYGIPFYI